ncbi:NPC intracellular cholesterol transporter 1 [Caerostris extrusa]|uniref:NPC intracellular cholesterol transporter 1 n=1 Tax=Caerostris extrusa TaxID=172846 RepID=A0AAV4RFP6_CAEEX|nr:NPC intracellular cholesterol transporter 1 [Caerostris extrusa]
MARCPSCHHNFSQLVCSMSCSPSQSHFFNVTNSQWYAYALYESCKDLQGFIPGTLFLDFACGSWGSKQCSPEHWVEYIGTTPYDGGYSPSNVIIYCM